MREASKSWGNKALSARLACELVVEVCTHPGPANRGGPHGPLQCGWRGGPTPMCATFMTWWSSSNVGVVFMCSKTLWSISNRGSSNSVSSLASLGIKSMQISKSCTNLCKKKYWCVVYGVYPFSMEKDHLSFSPNVQPSEFWQVESETLGFLVWEKFCCLPCHRASVGFFLVMRDLKCKAASRRIVYVWVCGGWLVS